MNCPFKRCENQEVHCNGACHGLMPDGVTKLTVLPELREEFDDGYCISCQGNFCTAGTFCVAKGN